MIFVDDIQSPLTIRASLRYVQCILCKREAQLSFEELERADYEKYLCKRCEDVDVARRKGKACKPVR